MTLKKHIAIIDCAIKTVSSQCFNQIVLSYPHTFTFHPIAQLGKSCLAKADAYIVLGSFSNVCDRLDWHQELTQFLKQEITKAKPLLGICFSHQLLGDIYGSQVDKVKPEDQDFSYHGVRSLRFTQNRLGLDPEASLNVFTSHSYELKSLPVGFKQIANSDECLIDAMEHEELPIFSFQSHPEASEFFVENTINPEREKPLSQQELLQGLQGGKTIIDSFINFIEKN